jgi:asparagine synthase (glutamine-hydrolysing)
MLINYIFNNNILNYELSFGCFAIETNERIIFVQLAFDLSKRKVSEDYLKSLDEKSISIEEIEQNIPGGFFIVIFHRENKKWSCLRDTSGLKSGYFFHYKSGFYIGTNVHNIAKKAKDITISKVAVDMLLASEFILDGLTIYSEISEFKKGGIYTIDLGNKFTLVSNNPLQLSTKENDLSYSENKKLLKDYICKAHSKLVGSENSIYLSGGTDSCVMLAALDEVADRSSINNITYKVKGTDQDETVYAQKAAKFLGYNCHVIEINPNSNEITQGLEQKILNMNNPYIGALIFSPLIDGAENHLFSGQDTRLHTPDVNWLCKNVLEKMINNGKINYERKKMVEAILNTYYSSKLHYSSNKVLKNLDQLLLGYLCPEGYLQKIVFKNNPNKLGDYHLTNIDNKAREDYFDVKNIDHLTLRKLYNLIVEKKWGEQYTDDIRYMTDMGYNSGHYTQMPFYDMELSRFSSSIPFDYSQKFTTGTNQFSNDKVKVNKVLLREAFEGKISPDIIYRKKAVSITVFLLFNGSLGNIVKTELEKDLNSNDSLIKEYNYLNFVERYLNTQKWNKNDQSYLLRIFYLYTVLIYKKQLN